MSQDKAEEKRYVFYSITAEVSYVDHIPPEGEAPNIKKEKIPMLYRGSDRGIPGKELARIHSNFIIQFQNEYAATTAKYTKVVPEVTKVVILVAFPLGLFTQEEFAQGIDVTPPPEQQQPEKK